MLLDTGFHQGASLHSFMPQADLRVLAILSQPGTPLGLETLWQVCASLQRLGYPVAVLDGTAEETDDAPGLEHLLAASAWQGSLPAEAGAAGSASPQPAPATTSPSTPHRQQRLGVTEREPVPLMSDISGRNH